METNYIKFTNYLAMNIYRKVHHTNQYKISYIEHFITFSIEGLKNGSLHIATAVNVIKYVRLLDFAAINSS